MQKIAINKRHGGFSLSREFWERYAELSGFELLVKDSKFEGYSLFYKDVEQDENLLSEHDLERDDPILIKVVEELKQKASTMFSDIVIVEIPDDVQWDIEEYDGLEWVAEKHRRWY
jgi:hypothetical protein